MKTLDSSNYYDQEANRDYFSVSQYKDFQKCPAMAMAKLRGEYQPEFGRAFFDTFPSIFCSVF